MVSSEEPNGFSINNLQTTKNNQPTVMVFTRAYTYSLESGASITSGQLAVTFYQQEPVTDNVQPRRLKAVIYTPIGELISGLQELTFDSPSENPREREFPVRFILTSQGNNINNQEVLLRLEEKLTDTSHFTEYKSVSYTIRRSFTGDFDF
jgi:hypothetical protein